MASKTISDRTTVAGLEDPNEKEDDALQQKVEEFASRYYERILKMKKPKQTTLGPDTVGFVIMNESTGGSQGEDIEAIVGKDLGKVAGEIDHIVDQHSKERLDYMVFKKTAEELYSNWPNLSISNKIWALFHIGAKFLEKKQSDEAVLKQFPGQAMHEIGLDKYPQEMEKVLGMDLGTSV